MEDKDDRDGDMISRFSTHSPRINLLEKLNSLKAQLVILGLSSRSSFFTVFVTLGSNDSELFPAKTVVSSQKNKSNQGGKLLCDDRHLCTLVLTNVC